MRRLIATFIRSDEGQDLVEYALLTAFVGLAGAAAVVAIANALNTGYTGWDRNSQNLWVPPEPGAGS